MIELLDEHIQKQYTRELDSMKEQTLDSTRFSLTSKNTLEDETDNMLGLQDEEDQQENYVYFSRHSEGEILYGNFWAFYPNKEGVLQFYIGPDCIRIYLLTHFQGFFTQF